MMKRTLILVLTLGGVALSTTAGGARADRSAGEAPLRVAFRCSQANVALYQWQFNYDGTTFIPDSSNDISGDMNFVYTEPGTYYARVQWYDATTGAVDGQTLGPINVYPPPKPPVVTSSFGPLPISVIVGTELHPVTFTASAVPSPPRSIVSYTWDFQGDGAIDASTSGGPSSSVTTSYNVAGYYTYTVTAVDEGGLAGTDRQTVRVGAPPILELRADLPAIELLAGTVLGFNFSMAPSVVSTIVSAQINFGDGAALALAPDALTASHVYAAPGTYTVTLGATDDMGFSSTKTLSIVVKTPPIVTRLDSAVSKVFGSFEAEAHSVAPATITSYSWSIYSVASGGTLTLVQSATSPGGSPSTVTFTLSLNGTYEVRVQAVDSANRTSAVLAERFSVTVISKPGAGPGTGNIGKTVPPPPTLIAAEVYETGVGQASISSDYRTILPLTVRSGHRVTFRVAGAQGQYPLANFGWDLDGDHLLDVVDGIGLGKTTASSTQTYQYESPGVYLVECAIGDQNPDKSSAILARMKFLITVLPVRPGDTGLQCWMTQPRNGRRIWGNHVTVKARTSPASQTGQVEFQYRAPGAPAWTTIGIAVPPPYYSLSVPWDVSLLAPGRYELRALATDKAGNAPYSSEYLGSVSVVVDPVTPEEEENADIVGLPVYRNQTVIPGAPTTTEVGGNTSIEIPANGSRLPPTTIGTYFRARMSFQDQDPHPLETKFQKLRLIPGSFRSLSLSDGATLTEPSRITLYNTKEAVSSYLRSLGFNGRNADHPNLTIYQFDTGSKCWVPLFAQVQHPQEDLVRASTVSMGDIALGVDVQTREKSSTSQSACGLIGLEAIFVLLAAEALRRR